MWLGGWWRIQGTSPRCHGLWRYLYIIIVSFIPLFNAHGGKWLHSFFSWCSFCVGSRETFSRSTKRTTTHHSDCATAQIRRGELRNCMHSLPLRAALLYISRLLCEAASFGGRTEMSGWGRISMERNHKISIPSPSMLPYLMLKFLKSEV